MHLQENTFFDLGVTHNIAQYPPLHHVTVAMHKSRNFRQGRGGGGGGPGQSDKKSSDIFFCCFFLVLSLFYRSQMVNFKENYHFSFQRGSYIFQGGGGEGSICLFPIKTHIICDFPGKAGPPVPPLDHHLVAPEKFEVAMSNGLGDAFTGTNIM